MRSPVRYGWFGSLTLLAIAGLAAGCSDDPRPSFAGSGAGVGGNGNGGGGGGGAGGAANEDGGAGADGSLGGSGPDGGSTLAPPARTGLAVVNVDYVAMASSLSLLNATGGVTHPDCVDSATGGSGTGSNTLSSDITLPSQPQRGGDVIVIDRGNTALTFVNPSTCKVDRQISVAGGFPRANPHDVVILSDSKAYVTRYEKNLVATSPAALGDDLLIIDPQDGTAKGRIDLSSYAAQVAASPSTIIQARPDRAVIAGGKVVVTLNDQDSTFSTFGEGRLVVIDPDSDQVVQALALPGLYNCEGMDVVPGTSTLLVACGGTYDGSGASESALAVVELGAGGATLTHITTGTQINGQPVNFLWVAAAPVSGSLRRAFLATDGAFPSGNLPMVSDAAFVIDIDSGAASQIGMSTPFDLGRGAAGGTELLLPDATAAMPRIHLYDTTGTPTETSAFAADTVLNLPPREVAWY